MDSLRGLLGGFLVLDRHDRLDRLPAGDLVRPWLTAVVDRPGVCGPAELSGDPDRYRVRRPALPPLLHRRGHKPCPRLRLPDGHACADLFRRCRDYPDALPDPYRPGTATATRGGCLHARDSGPVQPIANAHPVLRRPALLPTQVRRSEDPGGFRRAPARRDRPGSPGWRPRIRGPRDHATRTRVSVVEPGG